MIDEKKLVEELKDRIDRLQGCLASFEERMTLKSVLLTIEEMPKLGEWIPCSERLPESRGHYLVCSKNIIWVADYFNYTWWGVEKRCRWGDIEAWMPLPSPYREEGAE